MKKIFNNLKKMKKESSDKKLEYIEEEEEKAVLGQNKIKNLKDKLKHCQKEKDEYIRGWQRERADFINYRNEEQKREKDLRIFAKAKIILEFLRVLDNLERAEKEIPEKLKKEDWVKGIISIKNEFKDVLKKEGVEEIEKTKLFDPEIHEAVEVGEGKEDEILEVLQKGYFLEGQVLRPAKVRVGKNKNSSR